MICCDACTTKQIIFKQPKECLRKKFNSYEIARIVSNVLRRQTLFDRICIRTLEKNLGIYSRETEFGNYFKISRERVRAISPKNRRKERDIEVHKDDSVIKERYAKCKCVVVAKDMEEAKQ